MAQVGELSKFFFQVAIFKFDNESAEKVKINPVKLKMISKSNTGEGSTNNSQAVQERENVSGSSTQCTPIVLIKKNGNWRVVTDYRNSCLNTQKGDSGKGRETPERRNNESEPVPKRRKNE